MEGHVELLQWYGPRRRAYPWREERPDPYRVLVSEVMLQQTQAARVAPAYGVFLSRFPTIRSLAEAGGDEVLEVWSGLGYNRRAIGLWRAAREVVRRWDGRIPSDPSELVGLAGVGPYTAGAVASIAYGVAAPALDVNARRVVARARLGVDQHEAGSIEIHRAAEDWLDRDGPGDWNQAVMDLGREVCRPVPRCGVCPLRQACRIRRAGRPLASGPRPARAPFQGSLPAGSGRGHSGAVAGRPQLPGEAGRSHRTTVGSNDHGRTGDGEGRARSGRPGRAGRPPSRHGSASPKEGRWRLMDLEGLDHVGLAVSEVERSIRWYQEVLGLERAYQEAWADYPAVLVTGGTGVALFPARGAPIERATLDSLPHVGFRTSRVGFEAAKAELLAAGLQFRESDHRIAWSIYLLDPDDHLIEITTYDSPRP